MVLCILALPIFAILGVFSLQYRRLARDALECLFRTVTLRKCRSNLDERIRSTISGKLLRVSPGLAKGVYRYYKIITIIFFVLLVWSAWISVDGLIKYAKYGNCNGPDSDGFCIFDPTGQYTGTSDVDVHIPQNITLPTVEADDPIIGPPDAELTIIEFGCYSCPFTLHAEGTIQEVIKHYDGRVNFQFKNFKIPSHAISYPAALAANCAFDQGKYDGYHTLVFSHQSELTEDLLYTLASDEGLDMDAFTTCMKSEKYRTEINSDTLMGIEAGVAGTPTFFIGEQRIVGPKPAKTFYALIDAELEAK
ncbi:MAG: thioredoxin domain-containing protein [Nanoarchaeota archaeon]